MLLELQNLTHIYMQGAPSETIVLKDVNLSIKMGEYVGIIGKTGSGKSTLIQHFNGILKPSSGKIFVEGKDILSKDVNLLDIRKKIGIVFQYPEHQLFEETVKAEVSFGPKNVGYTGEELEKTVREAIEFVGLDYDEIAERSPFELSGGQKRRVAIASILAMKPNVLILDEPTAGMDPKGREDLLEKIDVLHNEHGYTIILVSHNMNEVAKYAKRLVVIDDGQVIMDDVPHVIFKEIEKLKSIGLGVPQVTELISEYNKACYGVSKCVITVDEALEEILSSLGLSEVNKNEF